MLNSRHPFSHLRIVKRIVLMAITLFFVSSCSSVTSSPIASYISDNTTTTPEIQHLSFDKNNIENMLEADLVTLYGAAIRSDYRKDDLFIISEAAFNAVESEVIRRNLFSAKASEEIEQGIIYIYMPISQLFASLDGLQESESANFANHNLKVYIGSKQKLKRKGVFSFLPKYAPRSIFLACDGNLIGIKTIGVTTYETYTGTAAWRSLIRTNFFPGYFNRDSAESLKWREKGWKNPPKPTIKILGAGGSNGVILDITGKNLRKVLEYMHYPTMKGYLDKRC